MRTIDLSPLYRSIVGVDRMIDLIDSASRVDSAGGYPPFNIEEVEQDAYRVEVAVAGFGEDDLSVDVIEDTLIIAGKKSGEEDRSYLHRGIAQRAFERRFRLAEYVVVDGARLHNGLLSVELRREVPEAKKPRRISISAESAETRRIEADRANDAA